MTALRTEPITPIDPPAKLPVSSLSVSSLRLFQSCPVKWRNKYLLGQYEPPGGAMVLGGAIGAAEAQHYSQVIEDGEGFTTERVLDEFASEWDYKVEREPEIDWRTDKPGELKDQGARLVNLYHHGIAPAVQPVSVERRIEVTFPGLDWRFVSYLDLEEADGGVSDLKVKARRLRQSDADGDLQPTSYLWGRQVEGNPASEFRFHTMVRQSKLLTEIVRTNRTDTDLDLFATRLFALANEIVWRTENDVWTGAAPGSWACGYCGYAATCPWRLPS